MTTTTGRVAFFAPVFLLAVLSASRADVLVLQEGASSYFGTDDNSLYEDMTANTNGGHPYFYTGHNANSSTRRALLRFDLSLLPTGATVTTVTLTLHVDRAANNSAALSPHLLYRLTKAWGEGNKDSLIIPPTNDGGFGTAAGTGDATWDSNFHNVSTWTTPGGDFDATPSGGGALGGAGTNNDLTGAGMAADVQSWLDAPSTNFGWIIRGDETAPSTGHRTVSSEGSPPDRPRLTIVFDPPLAVRTPWDLYE